MKLNEICQGMPIWAKFGTVGYRAGFVQHVGRKWIYLVFPRKKGGIGKGKRLAEECFPRSLEAKGKDKPE